MKYAVMAYERNPQYRFGEFLGYKSEGAVVLKEVDNKSFGRSVGEIYLRECVCEEEAEEIAETYNKFIQFGLKISLHKIPAYSGEMINCKYFNKDFGTTAILKCTVNPLVNCKECNEYAS